MRSVVRIYPGPPRFAFREAGEARRAAQAARVQSASLATVLPAETPLARARGARFKTRHWRVLPTASRSISARGCSSAGRAPALQAGGHRFEPGQLHHAFPRNSFPTEPKGTDRPWTADRASCATAPEFADGRSPGRLFIIVNTFRPRRRDASSQCTRGELRRLRTVSEREAVAHVRPGHVVRPGERRCPAARRTYHLCMTEFRASVEGHLVDALASRGDEGRGTLRKASGRWEQPLIRRCPNGETRPARVIPY